VHGAMGEDPNRKGNSRRWIVRAVEDSLRRLGTDWIDLYQIHRPDHTTDIEETLWVLSDLVSAGKIRAFGCSAFPAEDIVEAYHVAGGRGYGRFRTNQPSYSMLARGVERSVLPTCHRLGMGVLTYSPLAFGFLSGKIRKNRPLDGSARAALAPERFDPALPANAAKYDAVEQLVEVADGIGTTLPELAMAFVTSHPAVTSVIAGPRTMDQLEGLIKAADLTLDDKTLDRIDEIVPPGTDLYQADAAWQPQSLTHLPHRRRPHPDR
jgi:aryl-alcohol dehydrogenase-like predicted oxidoreductase